MSPKKAYSLEKPLSSDQRNPHFIRVIRVRCFFEHRMRIDRIVSGILSSIKPKNKSPFSSPEVGEKGEKKWTWWDSNPRPHKETMRFLHAYSGLHFRDAARPGPPTAPLSPKTSSRHRGLPRLFPILLRRLSLRFGTTPLERRLVSSPGEEIKL